MKILKNLTLLILSLILFSACTEAKTKKKVVNKNTAQVSKPMPEQNDDYKILARGGFSDVETPFVFVARDAETYALLGKLIESLPPASTIDFSNTAVVAAFAGQKNTGGYSVNIHPANDKIAIDLRAPEKGAMVMQVITTPFLVAAVPANATQSLPLEIPAVWANQIQTYRVTSADFESSGGFAGRSKKISADGTIGVLRYNNFSTFIFNLSGKGAENSLKLSDTASGVLDGENVLINRLDAGNFAEMPHPSLKVVGTITNNKLTLKFESLPPSVSDGYMLRGTLEAMKGN